MSEYFLKDLVTTISSGSTPLRSNEDFWFNGTIPWLKTEQLGKSKYIYDTTEKISQIALEQTTLKVNPVNTLSIALYGEGKTRGNVSILKQKMTTNQACCNIVIDEQKADHEFVYYFLKTQYRQLRNISSGIRKNLNSNYIKNYVVRLPKNISDQQKIAAVLSSLDDKIELNNRINSELEAMAKTLYDYWFVQFDFPNKNGKPYKSSGGRMAYSKELKRDIPEGWDVKKLEDIERNIVTGKTPTSSNKDYYDGEIPFICIGDIRGNMHIVNTEVSLSRLGAETQSKKHIPKGAICVTCIASPGLVGFATQNSQTNQQINSVVCNSKENRYYIYFALKDHFKFSKGVKMGNTFANMNKQDFSSIKLPYPTKAILTDFHDTLKSSIDKVLNNSLQNQQLTELRDWLLPMLMNGQITVN